MDKRFQTPGMFSWCELMTSDVEAAKAFYSRLFGWALEPVPNMDYTMLKAGGEAIGGIMAVPDEAKAKGATPMWGAYVTVQDVDATAATARELGGNVLVEPRDIPGVGRFCVLQDPQGAVLYAIAYRMSM